MLNQSDFLFLEKLMIQKNWYHSKSTDFTIAAVFKVLFTMLVTSQKSLSALPSSSSTFDLLRFSPLTQFKKKKLQTFQNFTWQ